MLFEDVCQILYSIFFSTLWFLLLILCHDSYHSGMTAIIYFGFGFYPPENILNLRKQVKCASLLISLQSRLSSLGSSWRSLQKMWLLLQVCHRTVEEESVFKKLLSQRYKSWCLFGDGRNRRLLHSKGGLDHPDQKTHHEVAEGEVDGPWQQGWEAHAV